MYAERVARGAAFLDLYRPTWFREIDLGSLNLKDNYNCILGQLYGNYHDSALPIERAASTKYSFREFINFVFFNAPPPISVTVYDLGFGIESDYRAFRHYPELTLLWSMEIRKRLQAQDSITIDVVAA